MFLQFKYIPFHAKSQPRLYIICQKANTVEKFTKTLDFYKEVIYNIACELIEMSI